LTHSARLLPARLLFTSDADPIPCGSGLSPLFESTFKAPPCALFCFWTLAALASGVNSWPPLRGFFPVLVGACELTLVPFESSSLPSLPSFSLSCRACELSFSSRAWRRRFSCYFPLPPLRTLLLEADLLFSWSSLLFNIARFPHFLVFLSVAGEIVLWPAPSMYYFSLLNSRRLMFPPSPLS